MELNLTDEWENEMCSRISIHNLSVKISRLGLGREEVQMCNDQIWGQVELSSEREREK